MQVKKTNKYQCVVCGKKQSVRKVFAISHSAKDVREVVQKLNKERLERSERREEPMEEAVVEVEEPTTSEGKDGPSHQDYWDTFLEPAEDQVEDGIDGEDDSRYVTILPDRSLKRKRRETLKQRNEVRNQDVRNTNCAIDGAEPTKSTRLVTGEQEKSYPNLLQGNKREEAPSLTKPSPAVGNAWDEFLGDEHEEF